MSELQMTINIAHDFSRYPGGRFIGDGPYSGEAFREKVLRPAVEKAAIIIIELDDTLGYGSSFLEEAFGGLVRKGFSTDELLQKLEFKTEDPSLKKEIISYIKEAGEDDV